MAGCKDCEITDPNPAKLGFRLCGPCVERKIKDGCKDCKHFTSYTGEISLTLCRACSLAIAVAIELDGGEGLGYAPEPLRALREYVGTDLYCQPNQSAVLYRMISRLGAALYIVGGTPIADSNT